MLESKYSDRHLQISSGIYPREMGTYVHTKSCTQMFMVALFVIAKSCNQAGGLTTGERLSKLWYVHNIECYSGLKRNKPSIQYNNLDESPGNYAGWKKPVSKYYIPYNSIYVTFVKWKVIELENRFLVARAGKKWGDWQKRLSAITKGYTRDPVSWQWWWIHESTRDRTAQN